MKSPLIRAFFDEPTDTASYLVWDPATKEGVVIDPVLDRNNRSGEADTRSAGAISRTAEAEQVARSSPTMATGGISVVVTICARRLSEPEAHALNPARAGAMTAAVWFTLSRVTPPQRQTPPLGGRVAVPAALLAGTL